MGELARTDELLTELVEIVETARTLPMSSSVVLPRERVLDLLDELREVLPPDLAQARKVMAARDALLNDAHNDATATREAATAEANQVEAMAQVRADGLIHDAEVRAYDIVEAGKAEHAQLVSATGVHQAATAQAAEMRAEAEAYLTQLRDEADRYRAETMDEAKRSAMDMVSRAEAYAAKLTMDSDEYADRTLAELSETMQRASATADQGRRALAERRKPVTPAFDISGPTEALPVDLSEDEGWSETAVSA